MALALSTWKKEFRSEYKQKREEKSKVKKRHTERVRTKKQRGTNAHPLIMDGMNMV